MDKIRWGYLPTGIGRYVQYNIQVFNIREEVCMKAFATYKNIRDGWK